jgi:hypothetical protein
MELPVKKRTIRNSPTYDGKKLNYVLEKILIFPGCCALAAIVLFFGGLVIRDYIMSIISLVAFGISFSFFIYGIIYWNPDEEKTVEELYVELPDKKGR